MTFKTALLCGALLLQGTFAQKHRSKKQGLKPASLTKLTQANLEKHTKTEAPSTVAKISKEDKLAAQKQFEEVRNIAFKYEQQHAGLEINQLKELKKTVKSETAQKFYDAQIKELTKITEVKSLKDLEKKQAEQQKAAEEYFFKANKASVERKFKLEQKFEAEVQKQLKKSTKEDAKALTQLKDESRKSLENLGRLKAAKTLEDFKKQVFANDQQRRAEVQKQLESFLKEVENMKPTKEEVEKQKKALEQRQTLIQKVYAAANEINRSDVKAYEKTLIKFQDAERALRVHDLKQSIAFKAQCEEYNKLPEVKKANAEAEKQMKFQQLKEAKRSEIIKTIVEAERKTSEKKAEKKQLKN